MSDDDHYTGVLLEEMNSKMDFVVEAVGQVQDQVRVLPAMQADLEEVKADVKIIKKVVKNHEQRITNLEAA